MRFHLDTNILAHAVRNPSGRAALHLVRRIDECAVSIIVACEVQFGIGKTPGSRFASRSLELIAQLAIDPLDDSVLLHYAETRVLLEKAGTPIGANDLLIAAHALALNATLVTANEREFRRIPGLRVENWAA